MDFWTRLLIAGTLFSRIPNPIQSNTHRTNGWTPWIGRSLVLKHPLTTGQPIESDPTTETPVIPTAPPLPLAPVSVTGPHPMPVPVYVQPVHHRVGVLAPNWLIKGPRVSPTLAPRTSKSFLEKVVQFLPTLLNLFGIGTPTNSKSKAAFDELFRMFGIESNSIGVLAMNFLVFLAEKVAGKFLPTEVNDVGEGRGFKSNNLLGFNFPSQEKIAAITNALSDDHLTERVITNMGMLNGTKTVCQQKLVCKLTPFVKIMQRYLFQQSPTNVDNEISSSGSWLTRLYMSLPSLGEYKTTDNECDLRFPQCSH